MVDEIREALKDILIPEGEDYDLDFSMISDQWIQWANGELTAFGEQQTDEEEYIADAVVFFVRVQNVVQSFRHALEKRWPTIEGSLEIYFRVLTRLGIKTVKNLFHKNRVLMDAERIGYISIDRDFDCDCVMVSHKGRCLLRDRYSFYEPPPFHEESKSKVGKYFRDLMLEALIKLSTKNGSKDKIVAKDVTEMMREISGQDIEHSTSNISHARKDLQGPPWYLEFSGKYQLTQKCVHRVTQKMKFDSIKAKKLKKLIT